MSDLNSHANEKSDEKSTPKKIRLQVFLARCGIASRRAAEKLIFDGRVSVNGKTITTIGEKVSLCDQVFVDKKQIFLQNEKRYLVLNKPAGYICTSNDEKNRKIALDLLKNDFSERLFSVGRLDMFSSGVILFTNDGDFAAKIGHPRSQIEKEYIVWTKNEIPQDLCPKFIRGILIKGEIFRAKNAELQNSKCARIILTEGKNREIRRVFNFFDVKILRLKRIRFGNIRLKNLPPAAFRNLTQTEIKTLLNLCK